MVSTWQYAERAVSKGDYPSLKTDIMECINQRDINRNLESFKGDLGKRKLFKENINDLQRFGNVEDLRDGLVLFKDKGIKALAAHSESICTNNVVEGIKKDLSNIIRSKDVELVGSRCRNKSDYLTAIGQDEQIMKYAERAVSKSDYPSLKTDIMECINQRDINRNLESFKGDLGKRKLFKENINDLQRFGNVEELREGLVAFEQKGMNALKGHTNNICVNNITDSIQKDFSNIKRGKKAEFLASRYRDKSDYLTAVSKDDNIMKYIEPKSEIGQKIQNEKTGGFDFER